MSQASTKLSLREYFAGLFGGRAASDVMHRPVPARVMPPQARATLEELARRPDLWVAMLWHAMAKTGRGYRHHTLKRRPPKGASHWRGERRPDKVAAAERNAKYPVFTGKINFQRTHGRAAV